MRGRIIGYRNYDFQDKKTGKQITGTTVYVVYPKKGYEGEIYSKKISISQQRQIDNGIDIYVNAPLTISFDDEGNIDEIYNE